jgi:hypothetical protein
MPTTTIQNRGTGAGGKNTNINGKNFEKKISLVPYLLSNDFQKKNLTKKNYYLELCVGNLSMKYMQQNVFRQYMKKKYSETVIRVPDEVVIVEKEGRKPVLFVIEIKNQNVEGSVETKLWACDGLKYEYEYLYFDIFDVEYCIVVNDFLKNKFEDKENTKYQILRSYYEKRQIKLFYGESEKYANKICNYFTDALA